MKGMGKIAGLLVAVCLSGLALNSTPMQAQDGNHASLDTAVTMEFKDAAIQEVADYIAKRARQNIVVEQGLEAKVTINLIDVAWEKALRLACEQATPAVLLRKDGDIWRISNPPKVTMNFRDADIRVVIEIISRLSGANIIVAENVSGTINVHLKDVPWDQALENIVKTVQFAIVREEGNIIRIVSPESLESQMETEVFQLKYIHLPSEYKAWMDSQYVKTVNKTRTAPEIDSTLPQNFSLLQALQGVRTDSGRITYEPSKNIIIAHDTRPTLNEMGRIIEEFDTEPRQVFVEVRFVRTTTTDLFEYGFNFASGLHIENSLGAMVTRLPFNLGRGGFEDHLSIAHEGPTEAQIAEFLDGVDATTGNPLAFPVLGLLDFSGTTTVMQFLENDTGTEIVQAPQLLMLDNEEATIFSGETIRYVEETVTTDQFGNPVISLEEADGSPVSVGFQLMVKPNIVPGTDKVILKLIPSFQSLTGLGENITGFDTFTSGNSTLDLPRIGAETIVTRMMLEDGQTGVLGGLVNTNETHTRTKIPFLGDVPLLGRLFRFDRTNNFSSNLVIFVTPHIVRSVEETKKRLADLEQKRKEDYLQKQLNDINKIKAADQNANGYDDTVPAGNGILTQEEIEALKRKYHIAK